MSTGLEDGLEIQRYNPNRRSSDLSTSTMFAAATLAITLASLLFSAGYNWRRISEVAEAHEKFAATVVTDYMRKDVQLEQNAALVSQLKNIADQLSALQRASERRQQKDDAR